MRAALGGGALLGALLLAGCAPAASPQASAPSGPAVPVTVVPGDISRWSGAGKVALTGPSGEVLAQTDVAPDGRFTLPLPGGEALRPVLRSPADALSLLGCTGGVSSSDSAASGFAFLGLRPQRTPAGPVFAATIKRTALTRGVLKGRAYLYVNRPTRLSGLVDCGRIVQDFAGLSAAVPVQVDLLAQTGWNAVELDVTVQVNLGGPSASGRLSAVADSGYVWRTPEEVVNQASTF